MLHTLPCNKYFVILRAILLEFVKDLLFQNLNKVSQCRLVPILITGVCHYSYATFTPTYVLPPWEKKLIIPLASDK